MSGRAGKLGTTEVYVTVECVGCKARRDICAGEVPEGEMPYCERDYMPMIAIAAGTRRVRGRVKSRP